MCRSATRVVLVGFWNWALALTFARRCRDLGLVVYLVEVVDDVSQAAHRQFACAEPHDFALTWREIDSGEATPKMRDFVERVDADAILSADEPLLIWLARNRAAFEPRCPVMAGTAESYLELMSKQRQLDIARAAGFDVLPAWYLNRPGDEELLPADEFPVCLRPTEPNSVDPPFKAKVLNNRQQVADALRSFQAIRSAIVAQPFLTGPNLVIHGARDMDGRILALDGFLAYRKFRGFALSVERVALPSKMREAAAKFAELAGVVGLFHYDLLRNARDGRTVFLEINPRMGGTTAKVFQLGYDEPLLALRSFGLAPPREASPLPPSSRATGKRALLLHIAGLLRSGADELSYPIESRWKAIGRSIAELALVPDPVFRVSEPATTFWYLFHRHQR